MVPGMIGRDYFKRQARTLRKMVKVAQDPVVADRLSEMADDFESRAGGVGPDDFDHPLLAQGAGAHDDDGRC